MTPAQLPRKARPIKASWLALVAATTLGVAYFGSIPTRVSAPAVEEQGSAHGLRLVVQTYDRSALTADGSLLPQAKALTATQRAVKAEELRQGVSVQLHQVAVRAEEPVVVAWVEQGAPDLEYDALTARPGQGALYGVTDEVEGGAQIVLGRQRARSA